MVSVRDYYPGLLRGREMLPGIEPAQSLTTILRRHPRNRRAAVSGQDVKTFGDLLDTAEVLARRWWDQGIRPGDVVGVQLFNGWEFLAAHVALARIGAVLATVHVPYSAEECRSLLDFVGAKAWMGTDPERPFGTIWSRNPDRGISAPWPDPETVGPHDPLALFFTSGTHSRIPKPCLHSHASLLGNARAVAVDAGMTADEVIISASQFTHLFGMLSVHLAWVLGATQVLLERFRPDEFLALCREYQATVAFMVPTHVRDLLQYLAVHPGAEDGLSLREIRVAGAAVPAEVVGMVHDRLRARVVNHWGMSELGAGTHTHWQDAPEIAARTIGKPVSGGRVRIVSDQGLDVEPGMSGELWYHGPSLFYGYYRNPEATAQSLSIDENGTVWFKTGDLAALRDDGRVEYRGRIKDIVNRGGMKISAIEVESCVLGMPGVRQAALVPIPDARLGERGCLVLALLPGVSYTLDDVCRHLEKQGVAKFKWPEGLEVWDELPATPTGKIAKAQLRERLISSMPDPDEKKNAARGAAPRSSGLR